MVKRWTPALGMMLVLAAVPASARPPRIAALQSLQPGEWELRARGEEQHPRRICARDVRRLLQTEHARHACRMFVISDSNNAASVTYDCAAAGSGRTDIRVETPRLAQIRSQGVANGAPFASAMEARRVGDCR